MTTSSSVGKTIAAVRIATSVFFLLFGEYKLAGPGFAHGGFQNYLHNYISTSAVSFYRPVLSGIILAARRFLRLCRRSDRKLHWHLLAARTVGTPCLCVRNSVFDQHDSVHMVGPWTRCASVALLWERTGASAVVTATGGILRCRCRTRLGTGRMPCRPRSGIDL